MGKLIDPIYVTTLDKQVIDDEIIPYGDRISVYSESQSSKDVKELLEGSFEIMKKAGVGRLVKVPNNS